MNIQYILTHGKNGCNIGYGEISAYAEMVMEKYRFSSPHIWMWKMFQLGFAFGKVSERDKKKKKAGAAV